MKRCTKCGETKELSAFWFDKRKGRHVAACLICASIQKAEYRLRHVEHIREKNREWQKRNPDRAKAAQRNYRMKHPGKAAERTSDWRQNNREWALRAQRECNRKLKDMAYAAYGGYRCACCGETEEVFLSIDHVKNDGWVRCRQIYKWLAKNSWPDGFQILCMNCNFGKYRNGGTCPHQTLKVQRLSRKGVGPKRSRLEARSPSQEAG
jgi:transcription elongation factor Elf1